MRQALSAKNGFFKFRGWLAALGVVVLPLVFYWRASSGAGMFYFGDIARFFYPTRVLYAQALHAGRIGLWQPEILTGIPLLAEMQTGALYPPHWLLYSLLPIDLALNYDILLHLAWLALGMFVLARLRHISVSGAVLAALVLTLGGFGAARVTHPNVLSVAAWLPWLLVLYDRFRMGARPLLMWGLLVLALAFQWLGGHPQFALINVLMFGAYVFATSLVPNFTLRARLALWVPALAAILLGTLLASAQLLPTYEFSQQSARAGGVDAEFFTTFSYNPLYLALMGAPFLRGNPYPNTSVEVIAYVGILPLILAAVGLRLKRTRETWFWLVLALVALLLAFGGYTPLYPALRVLPLFNFFRVPARFLFPVMFSLALLAGFGLDALRARGLPNVRLNLTRILALVALLVALAIIYFGNLITIEAWLSAWLALPVLFAAVGLLLVLRAGRLERAVFTVGALGLTLLDLVAFSAVYAQTYNAIAPRAEVFPPPRVLDTLDLSGGARVLTSEWILPWISVMNESLYPNLNAAHGVNAAGGYTPLTPRNTREYLNDLSPVMLNKLSVRYYLIPQLLPVDAKTENADVRNPFIVDPINDGALEFSQVDADGIEIESSLAQSVNLETGATVAEIVLTDENGKEYRVPLQAGVDTAEWAYDRSDVQKVVKHARPEIASTFPARSAFPIEEHVGHTYVTRRNFAPAPTPIVRLRVEPKFDAGLIHIQRLALLNGDAKIDLAPLMGKGRQALIYRSEDVAVFENPDAAPRAFITHNVRVADDAEAFRQLRSPLPNAEIYVAEGPEFGTEIGQNVNERAEIVLYEPERVVIDTRLDSEGYLVLTDAWDPGWVALVDGAPAVMTRADVIFRAVSLLPGVHRVEFLYRPRMFYIGVLLSAMGVALLGVFILASFLWRARRPAARA